MCHRATVSTRGTIIALNRTYPGCITFELARVQCVWHGRNGEETPDLSLCSRCGVNNKRLDSSRCDVISNKVSQVKRGAIS